MPVRLTGGQRLHGGVTSQLIALGVILFVSCYGVLVVIMIRDSRQTGRNFLVATGTQKDEVFRKLCILKSIRDSPLPLGILPSLLGRCVGVFEIAGGKTRMTFDVMAMVQV